MGEGKACVGVGVGGNGGENGCGVICTVGVGSFGGGGEEGYCLLKPGPGQSRQDPRSADP